MYYLITDSYDTYSEFLYRNNLSSKHVWFNPNCGVIVHPTIAILITGSRASDCYHSMISLNRRNPRLVTLDSESPRGWLTQAKITISDKQYFKLYNISKETRLTYYPSIKEAGKINIEFPDKERAFEIMLSL